MPFRFFDRLKNEIKKSILRFCFYFNKEDEIQITDYHLCLIDSFFEFLIPSLVFHFHKKMENEIQFVFRFSFW